MTSPGPLRYRIRPPEVDAVQVTPEALDDVCDWLWASGLSAYRDEQMLIVHDHTPGSVLFGGVPRLVVPFGHYLSHCPQARPPWRAIDPEQFTAHHEPVTREWEGQL